MRMSIHLFALKDLSNCMYAEQFIDILASNNLGITKAGSFEPIKEDFNKESLSKMWEGIGEINEFRSCDFLFKGEESIKYSGRISWKINISSKSSVFNGISLWFNLKKSYDYNNLIKLGDDLFVWSDSVFGYISEKSRENCNNPHEGIAGLMWVNYFGKPYIQNPDFHLPENYFPLGKGARFVLSDRPDSVELDDATYIQKTIEEIGIEWFSSRPKGVNLKTPLFDKKQLLKPSN